MSIKINVTELTKGDATWYGVVESDPVLMEEYSDSMKWYTVKFKDAGNIIFSGNDYVFVKSDND